MKQRDFHQEIKKSGYFSCKAGSGETLITKIKAMINDVWISEVWNFDMNLLNV